MYNKLIFLKERAWDWWKKEWKEEKSEIMAKLKSVKSDSNYFYIMSYMFLHFK